MEQAKKNKKPREKTTADLDEQDDLDSFIEKRKIQNEALKKIVGMDLPLSDKTSGKKKN